MSVREAVIVGAVRTPVGRRGGILSAWHPVDLLGQTLRSGKSLIEFRDVRVQHPATLTRVDVPEEICTDMPDRFAVENDQFNGLFVKMGQG